MWLWGKHFCVAQVMLIGAGIGLTPAASVIQAILKHKWRLGHFPVRVVLWLHLWLCVEVASNTPHTLADLLRVSGCTTGNHPLLLACAPDRDCFLSVVCAPADRVDGHCQRTKSS